MVTTASMSSSGSSYGTSSTQTTPEATIKEEEEVERKPVNGRGRKQRDKDGNPYKRNGKTLKVLRARLALLSGETMDLAPQAPRSRLASQSLASALAYHLITVAGGVTTAPTSPPVLDLTTHRDRIRSRGVRLKESDPFQEVCVASLLALGSRRSCHSSIIGHHQPELGLSLDALSRSTIGVQREKACRGLVERAVEMAKNCNLLNNRDNKMASIAVELLRVTLFAVNPRHPFGREIADQLIRRMRSNCPNLAVFDDAESISSAIEYDHYVAILLRMAPIITEAELEKYHGYRCSDVRDHIAFLDSFVSLEDWTKVWPAFTSTTTGRRMSSRGAPVHKPAQSIAIFVMRHITRIQQLQPDQVSSVELVQSYGKMWRGVDALQRLIQNQPCATFITKLISDSDASLSPHFGGALTLVEVQLALEAERFLAASPDDDLLRALVATAKQRIVQWLIVFTSLMSDPQFSEEEHANHTRALLLSVLDIYPGWVSLAVEAAEQHARGEGPYAHIGLSFAILEQLRMSFCFASTVFARTSRQRDELGDAMSRLNLNPPNQTDVMASLMVEKTLMELI